MREDGDCLNSVKRGFSAWDVRVYGLDPIVEVVQGDKLLRGKCVDPPSKPFEERAEWITQKGWRLLTDGLAGPAGSGIRVEEQQDGRLCGTHRYRMSRFDKATLDYLLRGENRHADSLAYLAEILGLTEHYPLSLRVPCHPRKDMIVRSYFWVLPEEGDVKINTDGASEGIPGKGGASFIIRNSRGVVLRTMAIGLGTVTNYMAECTALVMGLAITASNGWEITWLESDSLATVTTLNNDMIPWILKMLGRKQRKR
ncbi:hypothetical protein GIB67_015422 [Kingdonia uniflora]|uniref:RNase H type-1 domain-containing protein n=1 Tax=Kingdonia uniflora TaxID=39325 RepID=A0A7J7KYZ3_9MAGN|nr:hypothetical protein GIB67_015422 [Kingdonia uniflora]